MNPLVKFRSTIGLSQPDLALITGLSRQSVSAIECGLWEHFPRDTHLKLKEIATLHFAYPWPYTYELCDAAYQTSRVDSRIRTRQTTSIATKSLSASGAAIRSQAVAQKVHPFLLWRERAVGTSNLRAFAKLVAINPELVREYERSRPFAPIPASLSEALLDCGVEVERLEKLVAEYWTEVTK